MKITTSAHIRESKYRRCQTLPIGQLIPNPFIFFILPQTEEWHCQNKSSIKKSGKSSDSPLIICNHSFFGFFCKVFSDIQFKNLILRIFWSSTYQIVHLWQLDTSSSSFFIGFSSDATINLSGVFVPSGFPCLLFLWPINEDFHAVLNSHWSQWWDLMCTVSVSCFSKLKLGAL